MSSSMTENENKEKGLTRKTKEGKQTTQRDRVYQIDYAHRRKTKRRTLIAHSLRKNIFGRGYCTQGG